MIAPTQRFSNRVENYIKYRPTYPPQIMTALETECDFTPHSMVADLGSGTGILTELLLKHGNTVYGVEPNAEMRRAAEAHLGMNPCFHSVGATAEATTLPEASVNFVTAGQAFHWFDMEATRRECVRILCPHGWVVMVWNRRESDSSDFQIAYNALLNQHIQEYAKVTHERVDAAVLREFFAPNSFRTLEFPNFQEFDLEALNGRLLSSSYAPLPGQPGHEAIMSGLNKLFRRYQENGCVRFEYRTELTFGRLT